VSAPLLAPRALAGGRLTTLSSVGQYLQLTQPFQNCGVEVKVLCPTFILSLTHCLASLIDRELIGVSS